VFYAIGDQIVKAEPVLRPHLAPVGSVVVCDPLGMHYRDHFTQIERMREFRVVAISEFPGGRGLTQLLKAREWEEKRCSNREHESCELFGFDEEWLCDYLRCDYDWVQYASAGAVIVDLA